MLSARPWVIEKSASVQLAGLVILKLSASNVGFSFLSQKVVSNYPYQIPRKNLTVPFLFRWMLERQRLSKWQGLHFKGVQKPVSVHSLWQQCSLQGWISHCNMLLPKRSSREPTGVLHWGQVHDPSGLCDQPSLRLSQHFRVIWRREGMRPPMHEQKPLCPRCCLYSCQPPGNLHLQASSGWRWIWILCWA